MTSQPIYDTFKPGMKYWQFRLIEVQMYFFLSIFGVPLNVRNVKRVSRIRENASVCSEIDNVFRALQQVQNPISKLFASEAVVRWQNALPIQLLALSTVIMHLFFQKQLCWNLLQIVSKCAVIPFPQKYNIT